MTLKLKLQTSNFTQRLHVTVTVYLVQSENHQNYHSKLQGKYVKNVENIHKVRSQTQI